jgi:hypothetical protein
MLVELTFFKLSNIDRNDLEGEAVFQPKAYMLFSALLSFVSEKYLKFENEVERLEATLSLEYEQKLLNKDKDLVEKCGDRVSDKKLEKLVEDDACMRAAIDNRIKYKNMVNTFNNILNGLSGRADMLIQLISKRKREQEAGVS